MDAAQIDAALNACERELAERGRVDLRANGFWRAVASVKRRRELVDRYADRVAAIDRRAFRASVSPVFPVGLGIGLLTLGLVVGVALLAYAFALDGTAAGVAIVLGMLALDGATHGLAHLVVGAANGIRFTDWFVDFPKRPQPGFKIDYASYLRAPARSRAWMHAAGAIATKLTPFVVVLVALAARAPWWSIAILLAVGALQIATDLLFSVRSSDWKKFRREMRAASARSS